MVQGVSLARAQNGFSEIEISHQRDVMSNVLYKMWAEDVTTWQEYMQNSQH